ncbi:uncharacterized protein E0L32_003675 [Thyridium curvatum]|uniref:DOMON domain-containing protein n=1 Tax=Thyridium curvatum TaxID=1093900 RepID=A0A507BDH0_9PEZI|nr:uncharacterized protein E0L32_003675 [Thyridium curvatum]TPX16734.1 hypothetical protein E0L32_003675 [Thyridium curvatum]
MGLVARKTALAAALLATATGVTADTTKHCAGDAQDVCYTVGVPGSTSSSGSGNIYFQISAPASYEWVALGTGSRMAGSNMFVMYQDGRGNVTVSPRAGANHVMPRVDASATGAKLTLLAGSGVVAGGGSGGSGSSMMVANVACANCQAWSGGGSMSPSSTSSGWIGAWKKGGSLASADAGAAISVHDDTTVFKLDLTKAVIGADANPFVAGGSTSGGGGSGSGTGTGSGSGTGTGSPDSGNSGGGGVTVVGSKPSQAVLTAHGVIMALVMVVLYPLGSLLMPLMGNWAVHAAWQFISFLLMWAGFGLGVVCAKQRSMLFDQNHTILGTVVVCLMAIQPFMGFWHHRHYVKHQARGLVSHFHIWWGRSLLIIGVVNGGLGLQLASASNNLIIAYSVVAGVIFLIYAGGKSFASIRKRKAPAQNKELRNSSSRDSAATHTPRRPYP